MPVSRHQVLSWGFTHALAQAGVPAEVDRATQIRYTTEPRDIPCLDVMYVTAPSLAPRE